MEALPDCPEWLTEPAKLEWQRVLPELAKAGRLATLDRAALAAYCQCFAHWQVAEQFLAEHGSVVVLRNDKGEVKGAVPAPQHTIACKMLDKMRAFAIELGLTPAARKRLGKGTKADAKPNPLSGLRVVRNQAIP
jgi:P27 family predicted phage terminase small subunit